MSKPQPPAQASGLAAVLAWFDRLPWLVLVALALTLGLAPLQPEPHVLHKLRMLVQGGSLKPLDVFDLCLHATPWCLLGLRLYRQLRRRA
jgi:hypothetical protein